MATKLVIAGWFASAAINKLVQVASSEAMKEWARRTGLEDDFSQLHITLLKVKALLDMAEKKEVEEGGPLSELLQVLRDVADDADDLLDEFEYDIVREKVEESKTPPQASNPFSLSVITHDAREFSNAGEAASKVREIQKRLDMVVDGANSIILALPQSDVTARQQELPERETSSFLNSSDQFVGRGAEVENIVDLLLNSSTDMKNPGVLAIIGIGGVGKTALAQHVYNHPTVDHHFELKIWVCVSENFDVKRLLKDMIEDEGLQRPNIESLNALQQMLKQKIQGKRFLLVLDDVWSDDHAKWKTLCAPLAFGSQESKILTTTRSEQIASMMCTMETPIHLEGLADYVYWAFFKSCAFGSSNCEAYPKLVPIGMTIAKRLRGSPLAAKTVGSLLSQELDETYWKSIMNSKIWEIRQDQDDIMPVLRLSYKHLPGHLKQCFAYCSLFPKDHTFSEVELVQMWMVQGFISEDSSKRQEDVGIQYCQELVMRSFFQKCYGGFEVHDLLHDLAQYVSSKECHRIENGKLESISGTIRHLSVHAELWEMGTFKDLCKFKKLRTLIIEDRFQLDFNTWEALHEVFTKLTSIRVLRIWRCNLTELPESIGKLKHLRYLDIYWNRGTIMLPKSLCRLYNLRVLNIRGCSITNVPDGISNLINLRRLYADFDVISKIAGIGKLTSLQTLSWSYTVKKENGHKITELRDLKELRGSLDIRNLENIENKKEATGAHLKGKPHIDELCLSWSSYRIDRGIATDEEEFDDEAMLEAFTDRDITTDEELLEYEELPEYQELPTLLVGITDRDIITDEEVLEGLEPHPNIKSLKIAGYRGPRTPSWINIQHLSNLESIQLEKCRFWGCLPLLGQLPSLKSLSFMACPAIKKIGAEFHYNGDIKGFSSLETLRFEDMQGWEEWSGGGEGNQLLFPVLREVTIRRCPNLRHISIHLPLSLTSLHIQDCEELMYMPIERLKHLVSLKRLEIIRCPKLGSSMTMVAQHQVDEEVDHAEDNNIQQLLPSSLTYLHISSCDCLCSSGFVPRCLRNLTSLRSLKIDECPHIKSLPKEVMSLEVLRISGCQDLMTLEGLQALPSSLQKLSIKKCPKLLLLAAASRPEGGDDQQYAFPSLSDLEVDDTSLLTLLLLRGSLPSLHNLSIEGSLQSTMFTAGAEEQEDSLLLQNLTSLQSLRFTGCFNLQSLPPELHTLSSLQSLFILGCSEIQSLPEKGLPASLTYLRTYGCHPVFKEHCQKETGADWSKIAHINYVDISD